MKILIILAHPEPLSMNGAMFTIAIKALTAAGHDIQYSNLYSMTFNPVSDRGNFTALQNTGFYKQQLEELHATSNSGFIHEIEQEQQKVEWCDLMIWQFPLWWFSVPGILKGWVDRVFAMGRFYGQGKVYENGIFTGKKAILSLTTGGAEDTYQKDGFHGDINGILRHIHRGMLQFTGFSVLRPHIVYGPARQTDLQRKEELERWSKRLQTIFDETPEVIGQH